MKQVISFILILSFMVSAFAGCGGQQALDSVQANGDGAQDTAQTVQSGLHAGGGWEALFTYDEANAVQFTVKAAIPGEEDAYEYPWGGYDDPVDVPEESEALPGAEADESPGAEEINDQLQQALEDLPPELREAAEKAMQSAQTQQQGSQEEAELPADWNDPSNQPQLGGRLELQSGGDTVIIEMSEYCVDADTTFTVTPVKSTVLPEEFLKGGFSLSGTDDKEPVALKDYAVITFLTKQDPGDDVVLKSLGRDGGMEYSVVEVSKLGDTYMITGAVEHFSTVGYGPAELSAQSAAAMENFDPGYKAKSDKMAKKIELDKKYAEEYKNQRFVKTIEFDEILFTTTIRGDPCQLHLRAKLVEQPDKVNAAATDFESTFAGKIWIKAYFLNLGAGYADLYYLCNNATLENPEYWKSSNTGRGVSSATATFGMTTISGSKAVSFVLGETGAAGRGYSMQSVWELNENSGTVKVTFTSFVGFSEKTFITGKLSAKTMKQAAKTLKWFLD